MSEKPNTAGYRAQARPVWRACFRQRVWEARPQVRDRTWHRDTLWIVWTLAAFLLFWSVLKVEIEL